MGEHLFVPAGFAVPDGLTAEEFRLEPLGPAHNDSDYAAWTTSISHIKATPGFVGKRWPHAMSLAENLADLERHARDFRDRRGFTYTVLSTGTRTGTGTGTGTGDVIGCVYIYPPRGESQGDARTGNHDAAVSSWVRADHAELDPVLYRTVREWLEQTWPFRAVDYAPRA